MKIAMTGSTGLIGSALARVLTANGHAVVPLVRGRPAGPGEVVWDPSAGVLDPADLAGVDAVVNLAGAGIGDHRWSADHKARIRDSRVRGTRLIAETIARLGTSPTLLSASAVGYYGDRGEEELTEQSGPGTGFLADVCRAWEEATEPASAAACRVVHLRSGVVLSRHGGALKKQLPLVKLGVGGRVGSGRQYLSWISIDDEVGAIQFALTADSLPAAVNLTAPIPVTNAEFTAALARALHRPAVVPVPAAALKLVLGAEMAREMVLGGQRVFPRALEGAGYRFAHPSIAAAFAAVL